jgi:hypothetical protein
MSMTNHKVLSVGRWMSFGSEHLQQNSLTGAKKCLSRAEFPAKYTSLSLGSF